MSKKILSLRTVKRQFDDQNKYLHEIYTLNLYDLLALLQEKGLIKPTDNNSPVCYWEVV